MTEPDEASIIEAMARAIYDEEGPECIDMDGAFADARAAFAAARVALTSLVEADVRAKIAAEIADQLSAASMTHAADRFSDGLELAARLVIARGAVRVAGGEA